MNSRSRSLISRWSSHRLWQNVCTLNTRTCRYTSWFVSSCLASHVKHLLFHTQQSVSILTQLYVHWMLFKATKGDLKDRLLEGRCVLAGGLRSSFCFEEKSFEMWKELSSAGSLLKSRKTFVWSRHFFLLYDFYKRPRLKFNLSLSLFSIYLRFNFTEACILFHF